MCVLLFRESHALAAGFALGFVTLGTANEAPGLSDLDIPNRLLQYFHLTHETLEISFPFSHSFTCTLTQTLNNSTLVTFQLSHFFS